MGDMPERVWLSTDWNAPVVTIPRAESVRLRERVSAFREEHDRLPCYHREDTCAEKWAKLRWLLTDRLRMQREARHDNNQDLALGDAYASGVAFALALLDSLIPEKENDHA